MPRTRKKRLFSDEYAVFYDSAVRQPPASLADYLQADHATVAYADRQALDLDLQLQARGLERRFAVRVPGFAALAAFVRGTPLLATAPSLLGRTALVIAGQRCGARGPQFAAAHVHDLARAPPGRSRPCVAARAVAAGGGAGAGGAGPSMPAKQGAAQQARGAVADLEGAVAHGRAHAGA